MLVLAGDDAAGFQLPSKSNRRPLGAMMKSDETTGSPRLTAQTIRNDTYTNRYGNQAEIEPIG